MNYPSSSTAAIHMCQHNRQKMWRNQRKRALNPEKLRLMNNDPERISSESASWLEQRLRPGNWYDIAISDEIPFDIEVSVQIVLQMFQLAFSPEIRRRLNSGELGERFVLSRGQLIQPVDGRREIRLNEEVRGVGIVQTVRPVQKGEPVYHSDLRYLEDFELKEEDMDSGHFTILWTGDGWSCSWDLRTGRLMSVRFLGIALEFLETAQHARSQERARACVDNLFSACELASKARLLLQQNPAARAKTHSRIHTAINQSGHLGNVNEHFLKLFNWVSSNRSTARYDLGDQIVMPAAVDLRIARDEILRLEEEISQRMEFTDDE